MPQELRRQCRFYTHFEQEFDGELVNFYCLQGHFSRKDDRDTDPDLAPACADFVLLDSPGSRWAKLPVDYKNSLV